MPSRKLKVPLDRNGSSDFPMLNFWPEPTVDESINLDGPGNPLDAIFEEGARLLYQEATESITQTFIQGVALSQDTLGNVDNEDESVGANNAWWQGR